MKKINWHSLLIAVIIPLLAGGVSALITKGGMEEFEKLNKPFLTPPALAFPIAWTILYIMMGVASYLVFESDTNKDDLRSALTAYGIQLFVNFLWSIIFFNMKAYLLAFAWLTLLWVLIAMTMFAFNKVSRAAALLLAPYLIWVTFAGYLNLFVYLLN